MRNGYKPEGYQSESPYLIVDGANATIEFLARVFEATEDAAAACTRAVDAGATSIQEPLERDDPEGRFGVEDARRASWWIATKVEELKSVFADASVQAQ